MRPYLKATRPRVGIVKLRLEAQLGNTLISSNIVLYLLIHTICNSTIILNTYFKYIYHIYTFQKHETTHNVTL